MNELYSAAQAAVGDPNSRMREIETIKEEFDKQHVTLVGLLATVEDPNLVEDETIRENFEHKYFAVRTIYTTIFEEVSATFPEERKVSLPAAVMPSDLVDDLIETHSSLTTIIPWVVELHFAKLTYAQKFPVPLPRQSRLTNLIIEYAF
ncbi:hypothetical protein NQ317_008019 [Molorchus minor]|uniref:Uncharacterized protein n=1 Tax=Molorchus minor TaxID=1323400 RepID=A0ABQ9JVT0_9CUCU|nr:hypothetical protein NQ317_008019 [Molorchus minor]